MIEPFKLVVVEERGLGFPGVLDKHVGLVAGHDFKMVHLIDTRMSPWKVLFGTARECHGPQICACNGCKHASHGNTWWNDFALFECTHADMKRSTDINLLGRAPFDCPLYPQADN